MKVQKSKFKIKNLGMGFGLVEIVIVVAMATAAVVAFGSVARISLHLLQEEKYRLEASMLVEEGFEGVRALRDQSWSANIATLANDTTYFLATTTVSGSSTWVILATPQSYINGKYHRTLTFHPVNRDASGRIADVGTLDPETRELAVEVSWKLRSATSSVGSAGYITNFLQN